MLSIHADYNCRSDFQTAALPEQRTMIDNLCLLPSNVDDAYSTSRQQTLANQVMKTLVTILLISFFCKHTVKG